jgi:hypothetical protein
MQDKTSDFVGEAQELSRSWVQAIQGLAEMQFKLLQQLGDMQREQFNRALTAAQDQLKIISQTRDPREFATAQTNLVQNYGQQYVRGIYEAATMMSRTWEDYTAQLQQGVSTAAATMQKATDTATRATQEAMDRSTQSATSTKRSTSKKA